MPPHSQMMSIYGLHLCVCFGTEMLVKLRPDTGLQLWILKYRPTPHSLFTIATTELFFAFLVGLFAMKFYYQYVSLLEISET